jgi:hypothetical protein
MTGSGFLMFEFKQLAVLKLEGLSDEEIREKVIDENHFQYKKVTTIKRSFSYLMKRVNSLDETLLQMVVQEPTNVGKVINFYSILKIDVLFFEFMEEVIEKILQQGTGVLEKKEINVFFTSKAEQSEFLRNLAESTERRLKSAYLKVLMEVGIMKDLKTREVSRLVIDDQLKQYLIRIGEERYLKVMGEEV